MSTGVGLKKLTFRRHEGDSCARTLKRQRNRRRNAMAKQSRRKNRGKG